jgi:hypothetical protein
MDKVHAALDSAMSTLVPLAVSWVAGGGALLAGLFAGGYCTFWAVQELRFVNSCWNLLSMMPTTDSRLT